MENARPLAHCLFCPGRRPVLVTSRTGIGNGILVRHFWGDEAESGSVNKRPRNTFSFNRMHVAGDALASGAATFVVRVLLKSRRARPVGQTRSVTGKAELVAVDRRAQLRVVIGPVNVVATETCDAAPIHHALHEVVSLHAILMGRAVRKMRERRLAKRVFFECPEILQI